MFTLDRDGSCYILKCDSVVVARDLSRGEGMDLLKKLILAESNKFKGENGNDGATGKDGKDGAPGKDGEAGKDGKDGKDGAAGADGKDGAPGKDGKDGAAGADGKDGAPGKEGKQGRAVVEVGTLQPSHGAIGALWFDTTTMKLKVCLGSQWV